MKRMAGDGTELRPAFDFQRFRYAIAFVPDDAFDRLVRAMAPEARPIARSSNWALFESTLPRTSILAPEPARDGSESLRARLERAP
jgi:hypothetical protein